MKLKIFVTALVAMTPVASAAQWAEFARGMSDQMEVSLLDIRIDRAMKQCNNGGEGHLGACAAFQSLMRQKDELLARREAAAQSEAQDRQQKSLDEMNERLRKIQECLRSGQQSCH